MKYVLFYSVVVMLLAACDNNKTSESVIEAGTRQPSGVSSELQQFVEEIEKKNEPTPQSLSGNSLQAGPNPHAQLTSEQHIAVAYQHAEEGRVEEALDVLTRALLVTPEDVSLIAARGGILLAQGSVFDALVDLEKAVSLAPNSAELRVNRSQAYRKFNRYDEAMVDLNKAIALDPKLVAARFNRGSLLYGETRYQEALADFNICVEVAPQTAGPYFNRAVTREALGDRSGALNDMNRFIALSDNPEWNKVAQETIDSWQNGQQPSSTTN